MKLTSTLSGGRRRKNVLPAQTLDSIGHRRTAATLALTQDLNSTCSTLTSQNMGCPHGARFFLGARNAYLSYLTGYAVFLGKNCRAFIV